MPLLSMSLAEILKKQLHIYLTKDNNPSNLIEKFFSSSGVTGKKRAETYLAETLNVMDGNELLSAVHKDINGLKRFNPIPGKTEKWLGSSTKLRRRLMEGICIYFNEDEKIMRLAQIQFKAACSAAVYGAPLPELDQIKDVIMLNIINNRMERLPEYLHENATFASYQNQSM